MSLPRGFKANAEREAARLRKEMGLSGNAAVDINELAEHLQMKVVSADKLVDIERLHELERIQAFAFSAATFELAGRFFIVSNPIRTPGRLTSDVAHEVSHRLLDHRLSEVREIDGIPFRTCKPDEEEQATAFGGTLLLPRPLLTAAAYRGWGPDEIAKQYNVTLEMARYRYNSTGVARQIKTKSV
ncbi:ImmA/IrrE family metallo-endopeptidase [Amycolatopsis pittospori]|uniref:ImmA/IrrE family metallo-endopeptidase n=1 Tax=Amycolatopsis pittospori TaxID=2749434 RepID=UPI0015F0FB1B|nr:ImmA/IrrE family metallo-endopeptidase [Amycolatopsis pittospori]